MYKSLVTLAFCTAIGACAAPQAPLVGATPSAKAQSGVEKCELVKDEATGTRVTVREVCRIVPHVRDKS